MVILLTATESDNELISGVPEYVVFSTNVPSTIFITFDGTEPDNTSEIAVGNVYLPSDSSTVTLMAKAISGSFSSDTLSLLYSTDSSDLDKSRNLDKEGIRVMPFGSTSIDSISFDSNGLPSQETAIPLQDLEIKTSKTNRRGEPIPDDSSVEFIKFPTTLAGSVPEQISSVNDNINFDPRAKLILIDGSDQDAINNQSVRIINRPHGTMDLVSNFYNEHQVQQPIVTANLVKSMVNPKTGVIVFYYRESRENRWIKSVQQTDPLSLNLTPTIPQRTSGFVFRWVEDRNITKIF